MTDDLAYPTKIFAIRSGTWKMGDDMGVEYIRWDIAALDRGQIKIDREKVEQAVRDD